ncbi:MAG: hypothetical protein KKB50_12070 [Planctomycetes bacterium]|nr:hypothetical protein [Planctomycetota bacterium]
MVRWSGAWVLLALPALGGLGCNGPQPIPPRDAHEALLRVNDNIAGLKGALYCSPCLVSFKFTDRDRRAHRFIGHPATLIFAPPRCLYFDIKHTLGGSVARVGSNDERFWLWIEPEVSRMWWGTWADLQMEARRSLPVPPDELLDALMLRPLPERSSASPSPVLRVEGDDYRLLFVRLDESGEARSLREIVLDPFPPYQPLEIIDRLPDGRVLMRASLGHYRQVGRAGPYTARRYVVEWPQDGAEMRLDIQRAKFRLDQPPFCEFPFDPPVRDVERIGAPAPLQNPSLPEKGGLSS